MTQPDATSTRQAEVALLVIGSGTAGVSAAFAYREAGGSGRVLLVTTDAAMPYDRPPLSKDVLRGDAEPADTMVHPDADYAESDIEVRLSTEVSVLDVVAHTAALSSGDPITYGALVLATGASPVRPDLPGADRADVFTLRSLDEALRLRTAADDASTAVVVGSGFIGCEAAASLARHDVSVTLITDETEPNTARLGADAGRRIAEWLRAEGVQLILDDAVASIEDGAVRTTRGHTVPADLVLLATGVRPDVELARAAGIAVEEGRIRVDSSMRTDADNVYAAGDAALATNEAAGRPIAVEHWGDAMAMGEIAGKVAAGRSAQWDAAPGFWSTIGDHTLKYSAWGDGYDDARVVDGPGGGFTVWYSRDGIVVGVLTHEADDDYDRGGQLVTDGASSTAER